MASPRHSSGSPSRRLLFIGAVVVVLGGGVGAFFALSGGGGSGGGGGGSPSSSGPPVPSFSFHLASVRATPTGTKVNLQQTAHTAGDAIHHTLDRLYVAAFLDPGAWGTGHYHGAWETFTSDAVAKARQDEATLTLGTAAGRSFATVLPHSGQLKVQVLLDPAGHPSTAIADVTFDARATTTNGAKDVIRSNGHFFLRPSPRGWSIYAYEVTRADGPAPVPSPAASASASGTASP